MTTYRAVRVADGTPVVIKEMLVSSIGDKIEQMFRREARVLRQLDHPQIPVHLDHFAVRRGRTRSLYMVLEYIEGCTLAAELAVHRYTEAEVLAVCAELSLILDYLHSLSPPVIHRDLKPSNVMRRRDGALILIDFGAVRDALADADLGGSTVAGTFGYMAPEQFRGEASAASDLYGLGALAVALLTRREPHEMLDALGRLQWHQHVKISDESRDRIDALLEPVATDRPLTAKAVMAWMRDDRKTRGVRDPRELQDRPVVKYAEHEPPRFEDVLLPIPAAPSRGKDASNDDVDVRLDSSIVIGVGISVIAFIAFIAFNLLLTVIGFFWAWLLL